MTLVRPPLRRVVVASKAEAAVAHEVVGVSKPPTALVSPEGFDAASKTGLSALVKPRSIAQQLTLEDFGLDPGPPTVSAKAVVADALELLKESGVTVARALANASDRLGVPQDPEQLPDLVKALGPATLPLLSTSEALVGLSSWKVEPAVVLPALLEQGRAAPDLYRQSLQALMANPNVSHAQAMALQDALVRTAMSGTAQAPQLDGSLTLDAFVSNLNALGWGETFGTSLPMVGRLIKQGFAFEAQTLRPLADLAVASPDLHTRRQAAALFWHSSNTTEAAVKSYLAGVLDGSSYTSHEQGIAHFEEPDAAPLLDSRGWQSMPWAGELLAEMLGAAPAHAEILPAVFAAAAFEGKGKASTQTLREVARAAMSWSTLPPERLIAAADTRIVDDFLYVIEDRGDLLGTLLNRHPDLARLAPRLLGRMASDSFGRNAFSTSRLTEATDFLAEVRAVKAELEAAPLESWVYEGSAPDLRDSNAARTRQYRLTHFDRLLGRATPQSVLALLSQQPFGDRGHDLSVVAEGRELGLSSQQMFDALSKRTLEWKNDFDAAADLLADPAMSSSSFSEHFSTVFAGVSAGSQRVKLLEALLRRAVSKADVIEPLRQAVGSMAGAGRLHEDLLAAGLSRELVVALWANPRPSKPAAVPKDLRFTPSNELPRQLRDAREARLIDFRQRALEARPADPPGRSESAVDDTSALELALSSDALSMSDEHLDAKLGRVSAENPYRFLIDLRRGAPYAELRAKYFPDGTQSLMTAGLDLKWGRAESAPPGRQLEALLGRESLSWLEVIATLVSPRSTDEQRRRAVTAAFSRQAAGNDHGEGFARVIGPWSTVEQLTRLEQAMSKGDLMESAEKLMNETLPGPAALVAAFDGSLDFVAPTLTAAIEAGAVLPQALKSWSPLLLSPKVSKASALDLVWRLAEKANRRSSHSTEPSGHQNDEAVFDLIHDFALRRADLTDPERSGLRQALSLLK